MNRKSYMRDVYSKTWLTTRDDKYGFPQSDKNMCSLLIQHIPAKAKMLDVGIGTGYPIANYFQRQGYNVYGIDISPLLIDKCKCDYPNIQSTVGDADHLMYPDNYFDCVYCFHSTWYIPNLWKAINEMIRVTCPGGLIAFDIQNYNNPLIYKSYNKALFETTTFGRAIRLFKNIANLLLRRKISPLYGLVFETPTRPEIVYKQLEGFDYQVRIKTKVGSFELREAGNLKDYSRVLFLVRKRRQ